MPPTHQPTEPTPQELRRLHQKKKWTFTQIARHYGLRMPQIRELAAQAGIPFGNAKTIDNKYLARLYLGDPSQGVEPLSCTQIAARDDVGLTPRVIARRLQQEGVELRPPRNITQENVPWMAHLHWHEGLGVRQVAQDQWVGIQYRSIRKALQKYADENASTLVIGHDTNCPYCARSSWRHQ